LKAKADADTINLLLPQKAASPSSKQAGVALQEDSEVEFVGLSSEKGAAMDRS
jgi:hypothetical protein